jgi:hypothetical protein
MGKRKETEPLFRRVFGMILRIMLAAEILISFNYIISIKVGRQKCRPILLAGRIPKSLLLGRQPARRCGHNMPMTS